MPTSKPPRPPRILALLRWVIPREPPAVGVVATHLKLSACFSSSISRPSPAAAAQSKPPACGGWGEVGCGSRGWVKARESPRGPYCSKGGLKHIERCSAILPTAYSGCKYIPQRKWAAVHSRDLDRELVSWLSRLLPSFLPHLSPSFLPWELIPHKPPGPRSSLQSGFLAEAVFRQLAT